MEDIAKAIQMAWVEILFKDGMITQTERNKMLREFSK